MLAAYANCTPEELEQAINRINASDVLAMLDHLCVAPIHYIEDYQDDALAIKALLAGKLCIQMPIAGEGNVCTTA